MMNCFSAHVTLEPDTYSFWQAYSAIYAQKPPNCPLNWNLSTRTVNKNPTLVHAGSMMDTGDTQTRRKQNNHNSTVSLIKAPSAGSRFPYKWGAIVPNLFSVQDNNRSLSLAYIWMSSWSTHMTLIYLMDIWQKMFSLNRFFFWSFKSVRSSPSLPQLTENAGSFFIFIFEADSQDSRRSLSKQITCKTNIVIGDFFFFCSLFCNCHVKRLLASYSVQREWQNSAGAKCCGGEEGVCEECAWRRVPARCQRGGILKQPSLSSSSVILSLHSQMSEFCLPFVFLCPSSSCSLHILIHVTGGTTKTPISVC